MYDCHVISNFLDCGTVKPLFFSFSNSVNLLTIYGTIVDDIRIPEVLQTLTLVVNSNECLTNDNLDNYFVS